MDRLAPAPLRSLLFSLTPWRARICLPAFIHVANLLPLEEITTFGLFFGQGYRVNVEPGRTPHFQPVGSLFPGHIIETEYFPRTGIARPMKINVVMTRVWVV